MSEEERENRIEDGMDEGTDFPLEFSNPLHGAPQTASEFLELVDANARMKSENSELRSEISVKDEEIEMLNKKIKALKANMQISESH